MKEGTEEVLAYYNQNCLRAGERCNDDDLIEQQQERGIGDLTIFVVKAEELEGEKTRIDMLINDMKNAPISHYNPNLTFRIKFLKNYREDLELL